MKKTLILIATIALCATLNAQMKVNNTPLRAVPYNMEQREFSNGTVQETEMAPALRNSPMLVSDKLYNQVGETYYYLYTNCNSRNTIGFHPKSLTGAVVWTMAEMYWRERNRRLTVCFSIFLICNPVSIS